MTHKIDDWIGSKRVRTGLFDTLQDLEDETSPLFPGRRSRFLRPLPGARRLGPRERPLERRGPPGVRGLPAVRAAQAGGLEPVALAALVALDVGAPRLGRDSRGVGPAAAVRRQGRRGPARRRPTERGRLGQARARATEGDSATSTGGASSAGGPGGVGG